MTKLLAAIAGFGLGLSLTASALACYTDDGELYSMNKDKSQVTMKTAGSKEEKTFTLKKDTKISLNGKEVALSDLKSGDKVVIKSEAADDVLEIIATRSS